MKFTHSITIFHRKCVERNKECESDVCVTVHHIWNDKKYQLDATILIYYHKYLYMFRAFRPIFRNTGCVLLAYGVQHCKIFTVSYACVVIKIWCMCDRASYMKMTRGTNLMQKLWFIIINIFTCFGHLHAHIQEYTLYVLYMVFSTMCCGCDPKEPVCSLVHCV